MAEMVLTRIERHASKIRAGSFAGFDLALVYALAVLALIGLVLSVAASPVASARIGIANPFHFTERHVLFLTVGVVGCVFTACLRLDQARRLGILAAVSSIFVMIVALFFGPEIKGAHRWLYFGSFGLQPSEFLKPGFVCASAWFLAAKPDEEGFSGGHASLLLFLVSAALLAAQPDFGQLFLLIGIWTVMFFVAGWSWGWIIGIGSGALGVLTFGYLTQDHVRSRIDRFFDPGSGDAYQTQKAAEAISSGGVFGHDLHEASAVKASIPDAQTDFIFAVAVEEFGLVLGLLILALFFIIALRGFVSAIAAKDTFRRCAIAGLTASLCLQALINIGVNVGMLPAKGMTLPLVSYGGSSLMATGFTAGLLLAFTRRRKT